MLTAQEILRRVRALFRDDKGQGLAEYALILVLISIVAIVAMGPLGTQIAAIFEEITGELGGGGTTPSV